MQGLIHQLFAGFSAGSIYACFGVAVVMTYQSTGMLNFAQGEMALLTTYLAFSLLEAGVPYWPTFALTLIIAFALGVGVERIVLRPLKGKSALSIVIVLIGLLTVINSVVGWIYGHETREFPSPFPEGSPFEGGLISYHQLGMMCMTLLSVSVLYVFLRFTPIGLAMRAAAVNQVSSRLSGIPVGLMLSLGWGIASMLGAIAGMMLAPIIFLDPNMMLTVMLYGFAAAILGGLDNPWGAVAGGVLLGIVENLAGVYLVGADLKLSVALIVIMAVLLFRPAGIFGRHLPQRV
jgi:branched-chain amino acid transport system permease protein